MNLVQLLKFFNARQQRRQPMALATVIETQGSTYSKAGAVMLIDENGIFQGMLSGGCLEGDLAIRAQLVIETGVPQVHTYDLGADNDELWGLGVGCDGLMKILLQPVAPSTNYEPVTSILEALDGEHSAVISTVVESISTQAPLASAHLLTHSDSREFGLGGDVAATITVGAKETLANGRSVTRSYPFEDTNVSVLHSIVHPAIRLLILGGGLDAEPLVRYADELGWKATVIDHRPAYIEKADFSAATRIVCCPVDEMPSRVELASFDAAVVMSHHLASDRAYLEHLAVTEITYVGLLGPPRRRDRLFKELGGAATALDDRLYGPAGLDIGARGPAQIALSIVAQIQLLLADELRQRC
jgi:xanthine dehydrogenase accessory factor